MLRSHLLRKKTGRLRPARLGFGSSGTGRFNKRKAVITSVSAFFAASTLYLVSPYIALWSMASAVEHNDMATLGKAINWHSLCNSLQGQASTMLSTTYGIHTVSENSADLPDFGSSFATKAVSNAIQVRLTQENLGTIVKQFFPANDNKGHKATAQNMHMNGFAHFTSPTTFVVEVQLPGHENETPMEMELKIQKWHWKIVRITLPLPHKKSGHIMEAYAANIHS